MMLISPYNIPNVRYLLEKPTCHSVLLNKPMRMSIGKVIEVSIPPWLVVKLAPISNWYNPVGTADVGFAMPGRLVLMEP